MRARKTTAEDGLIERIAAFGRARSSGARGAEIELFVRRFCRLLPAEDIAGRSDEDLYLSALGMLNFMRERAPGTDKLRIYHPDLDSDGWSSPHTVIDLVTEDRPFIVDSVMTELARRDIPVYLAAHPILLVLRDDEGRLVRLCEAGDEPDGAIAESA